MKKREKIDPTELAKAKQLLAEAQKDGQPIPTGTVLQQIEEAGMSLSNMLTAQTGPGLSRKKTPRTPRTPKALESLKSFEGIGPQEALLIMTIIALVSSDVSCMLERIDYDDNQDSGAPTDTIKSPDSQKDAESKEDSMNRDVVLPPRDFPGDEAQDDDDITTEQPEVGADAKDSQDATADGDGAIATDQGEGPEVQYVDSADMPKDAYDYEVEVPTDLIPGQEVGMDAGEEAGTDAGEEAGMDSGEEAGMDARKEAGVDADPEDLQSPDASVLPDGSLADIEYENLPDHSQPGPEEAPDTGYAAYCEWVQTSGYEECWIGKVTNGEILTPDCYDGENNDCDGGTDEYFKCNPWYGPSCDVVVEICDGVDQDNDGISDEYVCSDCRSEGVEWEYCGNTEGICGGAQGIRECNLSGFPTVWFFCDGNMEPDPDGEQPDNGLDDDCDGEVDEVDKR